MRLERLNDDPRVLLVDAVLPPADCQDIIALGGTSMAPALVSGDAKGISSPGRVNDVAWVAHDACPALARACAAIAELAGQPLAHAEKAQVIRYGVGGEYRAHFDAFDPTMPRGRRNMAGGGQRLVTALCYLNAVEAGGGTDFPRLDVRVTPQPGRVLIFDNCIAGGTRRSPLMLHAGLPVEAGEKWAFNLWFRERARRPNA